MVAYVIGELKTNNPDSLHDYRKAARAAIEKHGGRVLARGPLVTLEGESESEGDGTIVVITTFPSLEEARRFYDSPEYQAAIALRKGKATLRLIAVEGLPEVSP
jgi:uncharacterized protein (DUF1330 family)